jgi:hypothetical protein
MAGSNMLKWLRRLVVTLAPLGLLAKIFIDKRRTQLSTDAGRLLEYLATHTSGPVPELSSRLRLSLDETLRLLTELEQRGLVQLSGNHGKGHVRIAAITNAGRERTQPGQ